MTSIFSFPSGLGSLFLSSLDAKLMPEHLLRLCLEHKQTIVSSSKSAQKYNFYKVIKFLAPYYYNVYFLFISLYSNLIYIPFLGFKCSSYGSNGEITYSSSTEDSFLSE